MNLMVYAPYGRAGVRMIQNTAGDWRRDLATGNSRSHFSVEGASSTSSRTVSASAAQGISSTQTHWLMLLNPREIAYSVPQLFDFIERNDLRAGTPVLAGCLLTSM